MAIVRNSVESIRRESAAGVRQNSTRKILRTSELEWDHVRPLFSIHGCCCLWRGGACSAQSRSCLRTGADACRNSVSRTNAGPCRDARAHPLCNACAGADPDGGFKQDFASRRSYRAARRSSPASSSRAHGRQTGRSYQRRRHPAWRSCACDRPTADRAADRGRPERKVRPGP